MFSPPYPASVATFSTPSPSPRRPRWPGTTWVSAALRNYSLGRKHRVRNSFKFFLRACGQPRLTQAWLARLTQPDIAPLWELRPRLALKLQRPYLSSEFGATLRCAALLGHYHQLPYVLHAEALTHIYRDGLPVLRLTNTAGGREIDLTFMYKNEFEMEGELTLTLTDRQTGLMLAGLTFCLAYNEGRYIALIGGLQASADPRTRGLIHYVAKEMHGLRPKALGLWCLQQVGALWGVEMIQAVGDSQHIYRHWRKRKEIAASYDEFWAESDGRLLPGGGWELPVTPRERSREELKPSRRKQHERRYAMLAEIKTALSAALQDLAPGAPVAHRLSDLPCAVGFSGRDSAPATVSDPAGSASE